MPTHLPSLEQAHIVNGRQDSSQQLAFPGVLRVTIRLMSRMVVCDLCDTNLGVLIEREEVDSESLDFLPNDDCLHVTREDLVEDIEAIYAGESSLPASLRRIAVRARQMPH